MADKVVFKNIFNKNKFKMRNKTVSNKTKGGIWGTVVGVLLVAAGSYFGVPIPEEIATEFAGGVVALIGFLGSYFASPDDPTDIDTSTEE